MEIIHYRNLFLLLLLIPIIWAWIRHRKLLARRFSLYAEAKFLPIYLAGNKPVIQYLRLLFRVLALVMLVLALIRPQWGFQESDVEISNVDEDSFDIVFAVDVSKSMDATDLKPSRLYRAKMSLVSFLEKIKDDRVSIIAFAGEAEILCPLTQDYDSARMLITSLSTNSIGKYGTNLGVALRTALDAFDTAAENRILILVSDGEDIGKQALAAAQNLKQEGIVVYTLGIGSDSGAAVTHPLSGETHISKLDSATLREISRITGGDYYSVLSSGSDLSAILADIYDKSKNVAYSKNVNILKDQFQIFALLALVLLLLDSLFCFLQMERSKG